MLHDALCLEFQKCCTRVSTVKTQCVRQAQVLCLYFPWGEHTRQLPSVDQQLIQRCGSLRSISGCCVIVDELYIHQNVHAVGKPWVCLVKQKICVNDLMQQILVYNADGSGPYKVCLSSLSYTGRYLISLIRNITQHIDLRSDVWCDVYPTAMWKSDTNLINTGRPKVELRKMWSEQFRPVLCE